ncbi:MAG: ABC transporter substrate-binding protein, partial [Athalassotoga sp.]
MSKKIVFVMIVALLIVSLAVFADNATVKYGGIVKIAFSTGLQTQNYNPFSPNFLYGGRTIYEPLLNFNLYTGSVSPWLATSYKWEDNNLKLIFNLRKDVQWSDST